MGRRRRQGGPSGIVVIDKATGTMSATTARGIGRRLETARVGHAGTLDPLATGVLVVLLGDATKLARWLVAHDKEYEATIQFGVTTESLDRDGLVVLQRPIPEGSLAPDALRAVLAEFVGPSQQVVPRVSAVKVDGKRLLNEVRAGREVNAPTKDVTCFALELRSVDLMQGTCDVRVHCSKGYYIRSLARDLGERIGCGAHIKELRRTRSGPFVLSAARSPDTVSMVDTLPLSLALPELPQLEISDAEVEDIRHGRQIPANGGASEVLLCDPKGVPVAVARRTPDARWQVERGLRWV